MHLTARVAWHDNGWNGTICQKPECNTYCVGSQSYPGDVIARQRDTQREVNNAGRSVASLHGAELPPCIYSVNAFGDDSITGFSNPPEWMHGGAKRTEWDIPPATVCIWPYEEVYSDAVKDSQGRYDNDTRAQKVEEFIANIEVDTSLIFYYANYSNPFSEEERPRYVLVGVSRVREIGPSLRYADTTEHVRRRYAGGMVWARNITSHYPEQGLRLPYHRYRGDIETLSRLVVFPENPRVCKYGARHITDDDAIGLLEQFLNAIKELRRIGDDSQNWDQRQDWILGCITELWRRRGLYPGLPNVLRLLDATDTVRPVIELINTDKAQEAHATVFAALDQGKEVPQIGLAGRPLQKASRQWMLRTDAERTLLASLLPRLDLDLDQMQRIASTDNRLRETHGLTFAVGDPLRNPYLICESYLGDNPDDRISWPTVDRGVLPSPDVGGTPYSDMGIDDARRFRALCVDEIGREPNHTFQASNRVLERVNQRLETLPEWKSATFTDRYFEVDKETLSEALVLRSDAQEEVDSGNIPRRWLYLRSVHEDEREVEAALKKLAARPDICLARPFSKEQWVENISDPQSDLLANTRERYIEAVEGQATACSSIFRRPLAVVTGAAGTGKTTVVCAIILAVRTTEGEGAPITVMAPTGKASDRLRAKLQQREIEGVETSTVHSYLAREGWLNDNLTYRRRGGSRHGQGTIIVDEASMLDLDLMAAFVRAIDWRAVRRLVLVGDPNQLPPIGRGRVFADTIEWLSGKSSPSVAKLEHNLRQLENEVAGNGTGILRLANLFIAQSNNGEATTPDAEELLAQVHGGGDVDTDLRVVYWHDAQRLPMQLVETIEAEMVSHTSELQDPNKPYKLWRSATGWKPDRYQVLTPHRGEMHGVEALNSAVQERVSAAAVRRYGTLSGITLFDKVIQVRNRSRSNPIWAYNMDTKRREPIEIYNGQIGFVSKHPDDRKNKRHYNLRQFSVRFDHKDNWIVDYKGSGEVEENLELAYAVSIHKAQGSEFDHTYIVVPKNRGRSLSSELLYTALTRATKHCTLLIEQSAATLLSARRPENAQIKQVNSSLFEGMFHPVPDALLQRSDWYAEGRVHEALTGDMVRSKSELIIANLLTGRGISFEYEMPLVAPDGTMYLPDFSIVHQGEKWFWEHWGMMSEAKYRDHREVKLAWYNEHFPGHLIETFESPSLSRDAARIVEEKFTE